ncbi:MAG: hypothetical protein M3Y41_08505 [Pseudomonadota bacterium]|nr:hypothetical protein [Pseudomonadota bacterium]
MNTTRAGLGAAVRSLALTAAIWAVAAALLSLPAGDGATHNIARPAPPAERAQDS